MGGLVDDYRFLLGVLDSLQDGICIQDTQFIIIYQNIAHKNLFGDNVGSLCFEANAKNDDVCTECPVAISFSTGKPHRAERKKLTPKGEVIVEVTSSPLMDADGKIVAGVELVRDITTQKRMEAEILKSQNHESLSLLAGGLAHEYNNILTTILGNLSLAKMYANPQLEVFEILSEAELAGLRARDLTKQFLTFSKGEEPLKTLVSMKKLIESHFSFAMSGSNIHINCDVADDILPAMVDEAQMNQVLNNIVLNAQQAMPDGGTISVKAENWSPGDEQRALLPEGDYIRISITDEGCGIPENIARRIFDPFFSTKPDGSGLGLAAAYSIVKKHGGDIEVLSVEGKGTTFNIYLPASVESLPEDKTLDDVPHQPGKGRILVMDDEKLVRSVIGRLLNQCGYDAEFALDGAEAIDLYVRAMEEGDPFDAVIMDLIVPNGLGGAETIGKLLEIHPEAKAIVSSGYSTDPIMAKYSEYGFVGALNKPYRTMELLRVLGEILGGGD